jgi:hypothetical protein
VQLCLDGGLDQLAQAILPSLRKVSLVIELDAGEFMDGVHDFYDFFIEQNDKYFQSVDMVRSLSEIQLVHETID